MATTLDGAVPLFVEFAPGGDPDSDGSDWVWVDITDDVRNSRGVRIEDGRQDEANLVDARTIELDLNNGPSNVASTLGEIGCYSPRNPAGPYVGRLRKNTPLRVGIRSSDDEFDRTVSNGWGSADWGGDWTVSGTASQAAVSAGVATRDFPTANVTQGHRLIGGGGMNTDTVMECATPNAVTGTGSLVCGVIARSVDTGNFYSGWVEFKPSALLAAKIERFSTGPEGTAELAASNPIPAVTYTTGEYVSVRFQVDGGHLRLKVWKSADPEPDAWTLTVQDSYLTQGGDVGVFMWRVSGNTNATGPHFQVRSFHTKSVEAVANITELPVRWNMTATDSWAPVKAAGTLRRLGQGPTALKSPLYNQLVHQAGITGLWMGEDGAGATELAPSDPYNAPAALEGNYTTAAESTLPGALTTFKLNDGAARARGKFARGNSGSGFSFMAFFKFDTDPVAEHEICKLTTGLFGAVGTVRIKVNAGGVMSVTGYGGTDDAVVFTGAADTDLDFSEWTAFQLETETSGGNINWTMIVHKVGAGTGFGAWGGSVSGSTNAKIRGWQLTGNNSSPVAFSTIYGGSDVLPFVDSGFALVSNGYQGETAGDRMVRVFAEAGIPFVLEPGETSEMGYQPPGDALSVARDCEATDLGILYEGGVGLIYRPRRARYNRPVEMELDLREGQFAAAWEPIDDDRFEKNDVTVTRAGGGSARAVKDSRVDEVGRYVDPVTINPFRDSDLVDQATWRVNLGTVDDLRWPRFEMNFRRNFDLTRDWRYRSFGFRMTATGEPSQITGSPPDVIVEGTSQTIRNEEWTAECFTSPAQGYAVAVYGESRYEARDSVTVANKAGGSGGVYSTTDTVIYANTPGIQWGTQYPYNIKIGYEEMTVTGVAVSGSDQALTVTRSVNGVVRTHGAGEKVLLADRRRIGL